MKIELLVFEGCPNTEPARSLLKDCMATLGISQGITEVKVNTPELAKFLAFPGSPTLRVNKTDVAPVTDPVGGSLACRTYQVDGRLQGLPERAQVLEALRKAQEAEAHACCTPMAKPGVAASCPACGTEGKPVKPVTLRSLLQPHLRAQVRDEVYRFCASPDCELVYFSDDGAQTFTRADLTVRVGVKERGAPRPLCYCFDHSAESIREEWARTGKSTILEGIRAKVKAGACQCEVTNPGGGCCLGDITKELKALLAAPEAPAPAFDCCASRIPVAEKGAF